MALVSDGFVEVADRVWIATYDPCGVNVTVIDGADGRVVVDTRGTGDEGRELARDLRRLPERRLVAVVNTHAHFDHTFGNEAFDGAPIVAHRRVAEILANRDGMADRIDRLASWYPDPAGLRATRLVPPGRTFDGSTTIDVGGRVVTCAFLGRGHTDHDTIVEVPDASVLLAGDLVEQAGPPVFGEDAYPFSWGVTLGRLLERHARVVVPGHGVPVEVPFVETQRDDLSTLADLLARWRTGELPEPDLLAGSPFDQSTTREAMACVAHDPDAPPTS